MRIRYWLAWMTGCALAVAWGGCSSDDNSSTGSATAQCAKACSSGQDSCGWSAADRGECEEGCNGMFGSYPTACQSQVDAAFACVQSGSWDCSTGEPQGCDEQLDAFEQCAIQNSNVDLAAYCSKCASCFEQDPSFQEGFCEPFWDGSSFDTSRCTAQGDVSDIDNKNLSSANLSTMSCDDFDSAI